MDCAALILWMGLMFGLSTDHFSSAHTMPFTTVLLLRFIPALAAVDIEMIDLVIRKVAHLGEYFIFAILLMRVLKNRSRINRSQQLALGIVLGIIYAAGDELHQSFTRTRSASAIDVVIDAMGFASGAFAFYKTIEIFQVKTVHANTHPAGVKKDSRQH
jgi:VanZ family protein